MWHLMRAFRFLTRAGLALNRRLARGPGDRPYSVVFKGEEADALGFSIAFSLSSSLIMVMIISIAWYILRALDISMITVSTV